MSDRWLPISAIITVLSAVFGTSLLRFTHMNNRPTFAGIIIWLAFIVAVGACFLLYDAVAMLRSGERQPIANLKRRFHRKKATTIGLGCVLFAANLYVFGIVKPQLGQVVTFHADPILAQIDRTLLGTDAWRLITWFKPPYLEFVYHEAWFAWIAAVFFYVLTTESSEGKDRLIVTYFVIWSFFGPLVHLALPAAGPVFFEKLGYGNQFADLQQSAQSQMVADYLWRGYADRIFNAAGGISAMPSVHIATMVWTLIALRRTRLFAFSILFNIYIYLGSIAIGWHYAIDGIAGAIGAWLCYVCVGLALKLLHPSEPLPREAVKAS